MTFSVGFWDSLFGKKIILEIPTCCGEIVKRCVTRKWLDLMQREGKLVSGHKRVVKVHMLDAAHGYRVLCWMINDDVAEATAIKYKDPDTGDLYAIHYMEDGESKTEILNKKRWDLAYQKFCTQ